MTFFSPEEIAEHRASSDRTWENLKRLWDGKPQIPKPKLRSIDDTWITSKKEVEDGNGS